MHQLTSNVYVSTTNEGCNTGFVVTSDGVLSHDVPMLKEQAQAWAAEIAQRGPLRCIVTGEPHLDHITGLCFVGGLLIGHEQTRAYLDECKDVYIERMGRHHPEILSDKDFYFRTPEIAIGDTTKIYLGEHTFELMIMPGHTPCNICTFVPEEGVVFTSDVVTGDVSVLDEADLYEWIDNVKLLQTLEIEHVVTGHGEVKPKEYLATFIQGLQTWIDAVQGAIDKGMTIEEAKQNITMEEEFPGIQEQVPWKPGLVAANVERVYNYILSKR